MGKPTRKHFVDFLSPGTFVSEQTRKPIESWDTVTAVEMANGITERYNAKPYGFQFVTCLVAEPVSDGDGGMIDVPPKEVERSGTHWLGGKVMRYEEVPDDQEHSILRGNMRCNDHPLIIENRNSWRFTSWFKEKDVVVGPDGKVTLRGDDPELMEYRRRKVAEFEAEREVMMAKYRTKPA